MQTHAVRLVAASILLFVLRSAGAAPAGTAFTYQGHLKNNGSPANGPFVMTFKLFDALTLGSQFGATLNFDGVGANPPPVSVSNGLFTVQLDFGANGFNGDKRWLEITVAGTPLSPRQELTATPYAIVAAASNAPWTTSGTIINYTGGNAVVGTGIPGPPAPLAASPARLTVRSSGNSATGLYVEGNGTSGFGAGVVLKNTTASALWSIYIRGSGSVDPGRLIIGDEADGQSILELDQNSNRTIVNALEIRGGADLAESYDVAPAEGQAAAPGMVVAIDPERVGRLRVASRAYDRRVAGVVSGADGVKPGLVLGQKESVATGRLPIANVGRVWCYCDAGAGGPIVPGDLLTTSPTPGHAMAVTDFARSQGAVLGKAMSELKQGRGLVLVLVSLQ